VGGVRLSFVCRRLRHACRLVMNQAVQDHAIPLGTMRLDGGILFLGCRRLLKVYQLVRS